MAKKKNQWHLPQNEVTYQASGSTRNQRKKLTRTSRAADLRDWSFKLKHKPTGIEIDGSIPLGHYSKKEMQQAKERLWKELFLELEKKVAKHMKISGL